MYTITINRTLAFDISHSYKLGQILLMILLRTVLLILVQVLLEKPSLPGPVLPGWYDLRDLVYQLRPDPADSAQYVAQAAPIIVGPPISSGISQDSRFRY